MSQLFEVSASVFWGLRYLPPCLPNFQQIIRLARQETLFDSIFHRLILKVDVFSPSRIFLARGKRFCGRAVDLHNSCHINDQFSLPRFAVEQFQKHLAYLTYLLYAIVQGDVFGLCRKRRNDCFIPWFPRNRRFVDADYPSWSLFPVSRHPPQSAWTSASKEWSDKWTEHGYLRT